MKHILRLVTYGALTPSKWEQGRPSRARAPVDDKTVTIEGPCVNVAWHYPAYRMVGIARYPDRVESRYERYL